MRAEQEAAGLAAELRSLQAASSAGQHARTENGSAGSGDDGSTVTNDAQVLLGLSCTQGRTGPSLRFMRVICSGSAG